MVLLATAIGCIISSVIVLLVLAAEMKEKTPEQLEYERRRKNRFGYM